MPITKDDKKELDQIHGEWSEKYEGRKEDYFALMYLTKKLHCSVPEIADQVAFGGNDYGLDAFHIDQEKRNLYLYQFKWSENHNQFAESMERMAKAGMQMIFGNAKADPQAHELLTRLRAELYENKAVVDRVLIHFVFKGDRQKAEDSKGLSNLRENLENKSHLVHTYFASSNVELTVGFISDQPSEPKPPPQESHTVSFADLVRHSSADGEKVMHVGLIPIMDLVRIFESLGPRFLDRNIRLGLSPDKITNSKIREALIDIVKQPASAEVFCLNHNGVTLAAEALSFNEGNGQAVLKVPRLLNGAQTITTVQQLRDDNKDRQPALDDALGAIRVLARIVVHDPFSEFITNVTVCNNRQNPVEPWNLRANDKIQCRLYDKLLEQAGIYYSRQERAFKNLTYKELEEMGVTELTRPMEIRPLAQTFLAVQGEITRMSKMPSVFGNQKWYVDTFRESYLHSDVRKIVIGYKVSIVLRAPIDRIAETANLKVGQAARKTRNLVWALLIQGILNDVNLSSVLEDFGLTLTKEISFKQYLKKLASSRIVPILTQLLGEKDYKEQIAAERYDFLRTKEIFNQCMAVAKEKFDWQKKYI